MKSINDYARSLNAKSTRSKPVDKEIVNKIYNRIDEAFEQTYNDNLRRGVRRPLFKVNYRVTEYDPVQHHKSYRKAWDKFYEDHVRLNGYIVLTEMHDSCMVHLSAKEGPHEYIPDTPAWPQGY